MRTSLPIMPLVSWRVFPVAEYLVGCSLSFQWKLLVDSASIQEQWCFGFCQVKLYYIEYSAWKFCCYLGNWNFLTSKSSGIFINEGCAATETWVKPLRANHSTYLPVSHDASLVSIWYSLSSDPYLRNNTRWFRNE